MENQKEIMIMSIDLGDHIEILRVHSFDDPQNLAITFCQQQGIDIKFAQLLENNIRLNLQQIVQQSFNIDSPLKNNLNGIDEQQFSPIVNNTRNENKNTQKQGLTNESKELYYQGSASKQNKNKQKDEKQKVYVIKPPNALGEVVTSYVTYDRSISGRPKQLQKSKKNNKNEIEYYPTTKQQLTFSPQINKNSSLLAASKGKNSVYDRLFEDATQKQYQQQQTLKSSQQLLSQATTSKQVISSINFGEIQYKKGLISNEEKNQWIDRQRKEQINKQEQQCTYHPQINEISNLIMMQKNEAPSMLFTSTSKHQQTLDTAKAVQYQKEFEECTFQPQINAISQIICEEKQKGQANQSSQQKFQKLYEEFEVKRQKQQQKLKESECTFQPAINLNSKKLIEGIDFYSRMQNFNEQKKQKLQIMTDVIQNQLIDKETGQELFKPAINPLPNKMERTQNSMKEQSESEASNQKRDVFETLFQQHKERQNRRVNMQYEALEQQEQTKVKACDESSRIVEEKIYNLMKYIFDLFDSDCDGLISSKNIDISKIPNEILEVLTPILYELDEISQSLNFEEFLSAVERLLKTLNIHQKHKILKYTKAEKKKIVDSNYTFKPEINKKSTQIAQKAFDKQVKLLQEQQQDVSEISDQKEILQITPALFPAKIKQY